MSNNILADRIALQDVMLKYAAGVDDRDYELYQSCFTDDLEVLGFGEHNYKDKAAWLEFVWSELEKYSSTQHMLGPQLARIEGDTAYTRTDLQALHYFREGENERFILWATYVTDMRRIGHGWRIFRHRLEVRGSELMPRKS
jgi:3-phenylpropionate/cinnamic acid dioxygenase small subunit